MGVPLKHQCKSILSCIGAAHLGVINNKFKIHRYQFIESNLILYFVVGIVDKMVDIDNEDFVDHDEIVPEQLRVVRTFTAMEVDHDSDKSIRSAKGISDGRASMKEEKKNLKREKKKLAKKMMKKKMLAEFPNHRPAATKNTSEKLAKNCY